MTIDLNTQRRCLKISGKNGTLSALQALTKAKQSGKDPYLTMLESRNCPVENSSSPAQLIYGRCLRSLLPIYQEKLKIKSINDDDIQDQKFQKQSKQAFYYNQNVGGN